MMFNQIQSIEAIDVEDPTDGEKVDMALHVLKTATSVGIDLWSPGDLRRLSKEALRALAQISQQVE
eukprot:11773166-Karenia_brevis.AAC.1